GLGEGQPGAAAHLFDQHRLADAGPTEGEHADRLVEHAATNGRLSRQQDRERPTSLLLAEDVFGLVEETNGQRQVGSNGRGGDAHARPGRVEGGSWPRGSDAGRGARRWDASWTTR